MIDLLALIAVGAVYWWIGYQTGKDAGLAERDKLWDEFHGIGERR